MATALSFQFSENLPGSYSYSYSDLPLFRSDLVRNRNPNRRSELNEGNELEYNKKQFSNRNKTIPDVTNDERIIDKNATSSKKDYFDKIISTEYVRHSSKFCNGNIPDILLREPEVRKKSNKIVSSQSFGKVEGLKRKFEFQSRLTKSFDKCERTKPAGNPLGGFINRKFKNSGEKNYENIDEEKELVTDKNKCNQISKIRTKVTLKTPSFLKNTLKPDAHDKDSEKAVNIASSILHLRNSIFSSLKLPRKNSTAKMTSPQTTRDSVTGRNYINVGLGGTLQPSMSSLSKRKSAVELLAESKAFYVKSETVLDRKQELPLRVNSTLSTGTNVGTHYATLSGRHRRSASGEPLQNQLRRLLGSTSTQSPITPYDNRNQTPRCKDKNINHQNYDWDTTSHPPSGYRSHYNSGTFSANSSSGTSGSKGQVKSDPEHSRISTAPCYSTKSLNRPSSSGDNRIFFPDSFVIPKPSKSDPANVFANSFSVESPYASPEKIDAHQILSVVNAYDNSRNEYYDDRETLDYCTISPPAEYAVTERSNYRYGRSNSHSNTNTKVNKENTYSVNFNSHKSLPDLHKPPDHYAEAGGGRLQIKTSSGHYLPNHEIKQNLRVPAYSQAIRSNEALSCYSNTFSGRSYRSSSRGNEAYFRHSAAIHSSDHNIHNEKGSTDEVYFYNRSGSSYNRDSGGSSGHCSGPVGPASLRGIPTPPNVVPLQQRRDSGSSTQHSSTRSHRYSSYCVNQYPNRDPNDASHLEYHVSAPLQFQDGVQFSNSSGSGRLNVNATVSISTNFAAPPRSGDVYRVNSGRVLTGNDRPQAHDRQALVGIHFQASIPPVQFQDTQAPPYGYNSSYSAEGFFGRRECGTRESRHLLTRRPASSGANQKNAVHENDPSGAAPYEPTEASPPGLGNFKRQRCLRYKHRTTPRRPILRSKSDISDRYWRNDETPQQQQQQQQRITPPSSDNNSPSRADRAKLDKFFNQLGMDDETYREVVLKDLKKPRRRRSKVKSSPKHNLKDEDLKDEDDDDNDEASDELSSSFASTDFSFPDSNVIPNNADYTVQGIQNDNKPYRSYEPLSVVERNARIIKWLCNCRKQLQLV